MAFSSKKIMDNRKKNPRVSMGGPEIPKITVVIRLTDEQHIRTVKKSLLNTLKDMDFEQKGTEITVSAYPPKDNFGENDILAIVQKHDRDARRIQRRS